MLGVASSQAFTIATINAGHALAGAPGTGQWALVVPDGVSRVAFLWPRNDPLTNVIYRRPLRHITSVHANVAVVQTHRDEYVGAMIWYGANGKILKRIA